MRILMVRLRQIGDVVFTTPAIHALRRRFPDAHLAYIVEPPAAAVVGHVRAGNRARPCPLAHFARLVRARGRDAPATRVIVTAGPSERNAAERVIAEARAALGEAGADVLSCGEFSLAELR